MDYDGTITSKLKPIVTMLTEALVKDFAPAYRKIEGGWLRVAEDGSVAGVDDEQLWLDVQSWLLGLEQDMENDSDRAFARMSVHMIRKNNGWVTILTERVKRRIR